MKKRGAGFAGELKNVPLCGKTHRLTIHYYLKRRAQSRAAHDVLVSYGKQNAAFPSEMQQVTQKCKEGIDNSDRLC